MIAFFYQNHVFVMQTISDGHIFGTLIAHIIEQI